MHSNQYCVAIFLSGLLSLYGCATIINGSTQDVQIDVPRGTMITTAEGIVIPTFHKLTSRDSGAFIRLDRDDDYQIRFTYKGQQVTTALESRFDAGWLIPDYFTLYGLVIDAITGAWHSFDGIAVHFPEDSLDTNSPPYIEILEPKRRPKMGGVAIASTGLALPMGNAELDFAFFNFYSLGLGYNLSSRLTLLAEFTKGGLVDILPRYSNYQTFGYFTAYDVGLRFVAEDPFYLTGGGGLTRVTSDSLKYFDSQGSHYETSPANKSMGSLFIGIGVTSTYGFMELRHTFGLSRIPLSNGETGHYETTAFRIGVNLNF